MTGSFDVVVIGAGAAGLMCAAEAGRRGRHVCLLDHSHKLAEKIRISGAGVVISPIYLLTLHPFCLKMNISVNLRSAGTPSMILLTWLNERALPFMKKSWASCFVMTPRNRLSMC